MTKRKAPANVGGRPSKLTQSVLNGIARDVKMGIFVETACEAAGIAPATFYRWLHEDRDGFREAIKKAERDLQAECLGTIGAGAEGWQGSAWLLERRFPRIWAMRVKAAVMEQQDELHRRLRDGLTPAEYMRVMNVLSGNGEEGAPEVGGRDVARLPAA